MRRTRSRRLSIDVSTVMLTHLRELVATGMHGLSVEQCAEELLREAVRRVLLERSEAGLPRPPQVRP